ncbi:MAG: site-specific DNA-methyltransferase, partial [Calditrichaeota bacterium]|nr:site-specific DNA-methyltransferase [Calditrichota bacterium]
MQELDNLGLIYYTTNGIPRKKQYLDQMVGRDVQSWWDDIQPVVSWSDQQTNYPTQKPERLLERIINASSKPGDLVFDCFMGSGTTQAVAMKLGRRFIGADINLGAIQTTTKRLIQVAQELNPKEKNNGELLKVAEETAPYGKDEDSPESEGKEVIEKFYTGFSVYNVNHYDIFRNPVQAKELLMEALEIQPVPGGSIYDGEKDGRMVKIMPVNRIATRADLNDLISGFDMRTFEKRKGEHPTRPVERLLLVCMGHEPDLKAHLIQEMKKYHFDIEVEVVDILRDKANLEFKRDA